jgi:DNA-binding MurR/RpiR family transcriptional regulator
MDLMSQIAEKLPLLGVAEQRLAEYVRGNLHAVAFASARTLATQAGVSPATVVRFFPRLGYASHAEAQKELQDALSGQYEAPRQRLFNTEKPAGSSASLRALDQDGQNLAKMAGVLQSAEFAQLLTWLCTAPSRVGVMGGRYSLGPAQLLTSQLAIALPAQLIDVQHNAAAAGLLEFGKGDLVLCVSLRRYLRSTVQLARWLRERGVRVVALTDTASSPLAIASNLVLVLPTQGAGLLDSYVAFTALGNALVAELSLARRESVEQRAQQSEQLDETLSVYHERPAVETSGVPK